MIPADDSTRCDELHHLIESEIHSLSTRLVSPLGLGIDEIESEIGRLNSLLDLFRRRDEMLTRMVGGPAKNEEARLRRQVLSERARLGRNFNQSISLLAQSLRIRQEWLVILAQVREQVVQARNYQREQPHPQA